MLSKISRHMRDDKIEPMADWAVLAIGTIVLTTVIVGTVVTPAVHMQADVDAEAALEAAAL